MTEADWLTSTNVPSLTTYLERGKVVSQRKLRLFAVACCSLVEHLVDDAGPHKALAAAERHAEGRIKIGTLARYARTCDQAYKRATERANGAAAIAVCAIQYTTLAFGFLNVTRTVAHALALQGGCAPDFAAVQAAIPGEYGPILALLRDVVGNPFQPLPERDPAWLNANGGLAARLANGIYEDRRFAELPILADALEDAGCTDAALLEHLRSPGVHARGCWVLDAVLGKE